MINIGTLEAILRLKDELTPSLKIAGQSLDNAGTKMRSAGAALMPLSLGFAAAGIASMKFAMDLNKGMANVATLIPENAQHVQELKTEIQDLAIAHGKATGDLVDGLYQTISAFGDTADTVKILEINSAAATAGLATTRDAINLTSTVTEGYGDTTATAVEKVTDLAFVAVRLGKTTFPELAASVGMVIPLATSLNVSQEELFASFAALTKVIPTTAEVGTTMRGILTSMVKPTKEMEAAIAELGKQYGFTGAEAMVAQLGMKGSLEALVATTDGSQEAITKLFGRVEALTGAMLLTGASSDTVTENMAAMTDGAGEMREAFEKQTTGINEAGFAWQQFKAQLEVTAQKLGDELLPIVMKTAEELAPLGRAVVDVIKWFGELSPTTKTVVVAIGGLLAIAGPLLMFFGSLASSVSALIPAVTAVGGALSGVLLPALAAVATAIAAYKITEWIMEWTGLRGVLDDFIATMVQFEATASDMEIRTGALGKASELAGRDITDLSEAVEILTDHNMKLQAEIEPVVEDVQDMKTVIEGTAPPVKTLADEADKLSGVIETLDAKVISSSQGWVTATGAILEYNVAVRDAREGTDVLNTTIETTVPITERLGITVDQLSEKTQYNSNRIVDATTATVNWGGKLLDLTSGFGDFNGVLSASANLTQMFGEGINKVFNSIVATIAGIGQIGKGIGQIMTGDIIGGIQSAIQGVQAVFASIKNLFSKAEWEKVADEVGRDFGVALSESLAKEIVETADRLDLGRFEAKLLHLSDIMGEVGVDGAAGIAKWAVEVNNLMNAVALGAIPAAEGIAEIGKSFTVLLEESLKTGEIVDASLLQIMARAKELGQEIPEITAFIAESLSEAAEGLGKIGGIEIITPEDAAAQATIVTATFFATMAEQGLLAAADAMRPAWEAMKESLAEAGMDVAIPGMDRLMEIASEDKFRPLLEGVEGLNQALTGLSNSGYMTADAFSAFQQQAGSAFDQLTAAGLSQEEALLQIAPMLQNMQDAARAYGFELDADTQALVEQAEASGIAFKTDPMEMMVDVLGEIALALGVTKEKLGEITGEGKDAGDAVKDSFDTATDAVVEAGSSMEEAMDTAFVAVSDVAKDTAATLEDSLIKSADDAAIALLEMQVDAALETDIGKLSKALDAVGTSARNAGRDIEGMPGPSGGGGGRGVHAQHGFYSPSLPYDLTIRAHRGEEVRVTPVAAAPAAPAPTKPIVVENIIHLTSTLDGKVIEKKVIRTTNDGLATGRIRVPTKSVVERAY
jgi:TP901 family phage tail tape measure protein